MKILKGFFKNKLVVLVLVIAILLILAAAGLFLYNQQKTKTNPASSGSAEINGIITSVGKLIELPTDETPTLATVSDVTKLQGQTFFAKAQNGDKVLIYTKNRKAILFRPLQNKIIEVAIYNAPQETTPANQNTTIAPTPSTKSIKVVLYNGTTIAGYTKTIEAKIKDKHPNILIVGRQNASSSSYKKTLVIDMGSNSGTVQALSGELGGQISSLPSGEDKPSGADVLIILGSQ